jgi:DNA polymerase-4
MEREIAIHSDVVAQRLRRHGLMARTISLKIRFASFRTVTRSLSLEEGTSLQEDIDRSARVLLKKIPLQEGVRLIGVTASNLGPPMYMESLFTNDREKKNRAAKAMDEIQARFGKKALQKGFWLEEKK